MTNTILFLLFMVPGTLFLSAYDLMRRDMLKDGLYHERAFLGVAMMGSGIILFIPFFFIPFPELKAGFWPAFMGTVAINFVAQWLWFRAFRLEEASLISPLYLLTPPLVLFTGFIILGEKPSLWGIVGVLTTIIGLWILFQSGRREGANLFDTIKRKGVLFGICGAVLFAFSFPLDRKAILTSSGLFYTALAVLLIGVLSIGVSMFSGSHARHTFFLLFRKPKKMALFFAVSSIAFFLPNQALSYSFAAYASSVKRLWSLWTVLFSGMFFKERNIRNKMIATVVMLSGIFITIILG
ncbi:MAG: DMT family transporter [bacterium]|nr:DMT family transporter [bacterium]